MSNTKNTQTIDKICAEFSNHFVEEGGFMLARAPQPTRFLLDSLRTQLTDLLQGIIEREEGEKITDEDQLVFEDAREWNNAKSDTMKYLKSIKGDV